MVASFLSHRLKEHSGNSAQSVMQNGPGCLYELLLERAGMEEDACEIVLEGADQGTPTEKPIPPGRISYARSLPRNKAIQREVLVAHQMNGRDLPQDHGYPVRAIVPGHYGMASVKWLTRIHAVREPFQGYWQTSDYGYWDYQDGKPVRRPLGEMKLKSQIARPTVYETVSCALPNHPPADQATISLSCRLIVVI
jgi:DMSO/TMAO reductase YedYZ molybdopterin-dependent catalytic subunit